jgi:hypothetical protein
VLYFSKLGHKVLCLHCFGFEKEPDSIMTADPDPGRPKLSPKKGEKEEGPYLKSLNVLCRGLRRHIRCDGFLREKFFNCNFVKIFNKKFGLDPNPDSKSALA